MQYYKSERIASRYLCDIIIMKGGNSMHINLEKSEKGDLCRP